MLRFILTLLLVGIPATSTVHAETMTRNFSEMPTYVLYCDEDPGRINAGGGKAPSPQQLIDEGSCTPAEGVSVTFVLADDNWDFEEDEPADEIDWDVDEDSWFNRCEMDANGFCALESPMGFDIVLGAVLHEGTVLPGYEPAFFPRTTHNFSEFAGWGLALIPANDNATPSGTTADHQTMALNITENGEPGNVLTEWEFDGDDDDRFLATNSDGWVSNIVAANDVIEIDMMNIDDNADITLVCSANDDTSLSVESRVDDWGDLHINVPDTDSDIRCDVMIG